MEEPVFSRGHATLAEFTFDGVAAFEGEFQAGQVMGHGAQNAPKFRRIASVLIRPPALATSA